MRDIGVSMVYRVRPSREILDAETAEDQLARRQRAEQTTLPKDGDTLIIGEYNEEGVRETFTARFVVQSGVPLVVSRRGALSLPEFAGLHDGEWEIQKRQGPIRDLNVSLNR